MNKPVLKLKPNPVPPSRRRPALEPEEEAFYEQLALRRLRRALWRQRAKRVWRGLLRLGRALRDALAAVLEGVEIVQHVEPGKLPLRRDEWQKPPHQNYPNLG